MNLESTDLRVGNYVIDKEDGQVVQITSGKQIDHPHWMDPIPINKQWFIDLGFEENNWTEGGVPIYFGWYKDNLLIETNKKQNVFFLDGRKGEYPNIEYVHQLQNLYSGMLHKNLTK